MFVSAKKLLLAVGALLILSNAAGAMNAALETRMLRKNLREAGGFFIQGTASPKLHQAAAAGDLKAVKRLVQEEHVDVNHQHMDGATALYEAAFNGRVEVVQWLVEEADARTDLGDESGCTPLHAAAYGGNLEIVKWLVTEGHVDLDQPDHRGRTALYWAASGLCWGDDAHRHAEVARWLLDQGADPTALESLAGRLDESCEDIDRLLRERGRYVRDARQATRDVLISQNGQWESLLPLLHKFLGWHVIDIQEKSGGEHDDEIQKT
ncbi:MAG: ankyrin repeat domain-containing protein, partial [Myxococcota bacterium]